MSDNPIAEPVEEVVVEEVAESEPVEPTETAPEQSAEPEATEEEVIQYLELDGNEYDLSEVRKWRDGHLMQKDYTKKTQTLAEERKSIEAEKANLQNLLKDKAEITEMKNLLTVLVNEDEAIDWEDLKANDLERYVELKETAEKRRKALNELKSKPTETVMDPATAAAEQKKLFSLNPGWFDEKGQPTDAYNSDAKLINDWASSAGFTTNEFSQMKAHHLNTVLKAAKYDQLQEKGRKIKEVRDKVPIVTKPKTAKPNGERSYASIMYDKSP